MQTPKHTIPAVDADGNPVFHEVMVVVNPDGSPLSITGSGDAATATMQQKQLDAQVAQTSFLAKTFPAMFDSSYGTLVTEVIYANVFRHINPDGSIDTELMFSQRFDIHGAESWFFEYKDGSSSPLGALKSVTDSDIQVFSEDLIQSITEVRTLIGSNPPITSTRTRTYAMWYPHWQVSDTGWQ